VRGPQVAGEYLETGTRLEEGGWFPTRDLGYMDEAGFIFVRGRSDDTIIRGGENIAPSEIEDVLAEHPWVDDVAVAGIPDEEWGHRIAAFIVPKPGTQPDAAALREYARAHLRSSKTPDQIVFLPDLPRTPTGKIVRRSLAELAPQRADSPTG
jgi:acyl-CoA synthetase (AMP-forming)/AMP-acid ligase II